MHEEDCPDIGPVCATRAVPPEVHHTTLWLSEVRALAEYGLVPRLALQAVVPFRIVDARTRYTDLAGHAIAPDYPEIHHRDETLAGPGDPQLLLHGGVAAGGFRLSARLGVSFPLGRVEPNPFVLGDQGKPHEHIQLGTGTFDPVGGADASRAWGAWTASAFAFAQAPLHENRFGYRAGTRLAGGATVARAFGSSGPTVRLGAAALHEWAERWNGQEPVGEGNRGRSDLYVGPGVTWPLGRDFDMSVDLRARVWSQVVGAQIDMPLLVEISVGRLFHLESAPMHGEAPGGDVVDVVRAGEDAPVPPAPGRFTVVDFWAPWCEACKRLDAELRRWAAADARVAVRRVNIVDFDSPIARRELAGVTTLPHVRLVAPDGRVAWEGSGTPDDLLAALRDRVR